MKVSKKTIFYFYISQLVFIAIICLMPVPEDTGPEIPNIDKIIHLSAYAWLCWIGSHAFDSIHLIKNLISLIFYGILIEILQVLTGYRSFELLDIVANTSGAIIGYFAFKKLRFPLSK